ncbi:MAG: Fic family protein, partial [Chloroflexi bacterium]|nr:Fic family protein [Chloroflexota bacterium]
MLTRRQLNLMPVIDPRRPYNALPHLPPTATIETIEVLRALNSASRALADLNGATLSVPNPNLLVDTFGIKEAQATSEIEGVRTTSDRLFRFMAIGNRQATDATKEAARSQLALASGIRHLRQNPHLNTAMLVGLCSQILGNQVDIRDEGAHIEDSLSGAIIYTPPFGQNLILRLLDNLLQFVAAAEPNWDPLIKMAILHYQFEAIHPFPDGNGRTGRVMNVLYLMQQRLLDYPVLYLSRFFVENLGEYYEGLKAVTEKSDWEQWILYILRAIREVASD